MGGSVPKLAKKLRSIVGLRAVNVCEYCDVPSQLKHQLAMCATFALKKSGEVPQNDYKTNWGVPLVAIAAYLDMHFRKMTMTTFGIEPWWEANFVHEALNTHSLLTFL